jgi:RNA polymerase sigma factor (sigma-70 family)
VTAPDGPAAPEDLLRALAPAALGAVVRRYGDFAAAEDAVQEALAVAAQRWPGEGRPDNPLAWVVRVAGRRLIDARRSDDARRRREELAASWSRAEPDPAPRADDTLVLLELCCHPALTPAAAIPLTLRAVGGLTTREIAAAFLVPEATMAQRISRAKARIAAAGATFRRPAPDEEPERRRSVRHVLYLLFNEGYATSAGPELTRHDLSGEAVRLTRALHAVVPDDPETTGLLALMLLTDARRPARTGPGGELVPLAEQDRTHWDRALITEGTALLEEAWAGGTVGEYQLQAAVAAAHDRAARHEDTDWDGIASLYGVLEQLTRNPMVVLNRAVAVAMAQGPIAGLALLDSLDGPGAPLAGHHRLAAVRAHLLEQAGDRAGAAAAFTQAAAGTANLRERDYLTTRAAHLAHGAD